MNIQQDFKELLALLEKHHVDYMVVGGYAVAFHGFPRFTKDLDIFYHGVAENVAKVTAALKEFGFPEKDLPPSLFLEPGNVITFGVAPVRVDFLNQIDGVAFEEAELVKGRYGDIEVRFIGKAELVKNKLATKRLQDKVDAERLSQEGSGEGA